ncbi:MAG: homoserine dehydrogenase [Trueperaceae bacterium]
MARPPKKVRVAVLGAGNVGQALLARLSTFNTNFNTKAEIEVTGVLVRDTAKLRTSEVSCYPLASDPVALIDGADLVIELMGGLEPATSLMLNALQNGKQVITANKAALAERWSEFAPYLAKGRLYFEASVMSGTPVVGPLSGALRGSTPLELHAVLNGTTTFILSRLEAGEDFAPALAEAQRLGFAEADPTLDIEGIDAAHKLALLARLAFDPLLDWSAVAASTHGISHLTPAIVREAMEDGGSVRLVGSIYPESGGWETRVRTVYLPAGHPLASTADSGNALLLRTRELGEIFIQGPGAGGGATAAAVLADLQGALDGRPGPGPLPGRAPLPTGHHAEDLGELLKA